MEKIEILNVIIEKNEIKLLNYIAKRNILNHVEILFYNISNIIE